MPAGDTGVRFTNQLAESRHLTNQILLNGSGVAAGDVDGDGWCDLMFYGLAGASRLYRNLGHWRFEDITDMAGVACPGLDATGVALADLDGDGDLDLVINSVAGGTHVFLNDGHAHFRELTKAAALNPQRGGMSLALGDIDGDGDLDLYVANYRSVTLRDQPNTRFSIKTIDGRPQVTAIDGRPITDPDLVDRFNFKITAGDGGGTFNQDENGEADALFLNDGSGLFTPLPFTGGAFLDEDGRPLTKPPFDWGLSVMFRDLNGDRAPDIYICNDFRSPDRVWLNDGRGHFRALPRLALRQTCLSSMGVDFADINRDGWDDFFVVDMLSPQHQRRLMQRIDIKPEILPLGAIDNRPQYPRNALFLNRGDGTYAELAQLSGLEATEWSWTPIFLDVDLDGYEDLLISNGFERDGMNVDVLRRLETMKKEKPLSSLEQLRLRRIFPRLDTPNLAFRNLGNLKFEDKSAEWGFNLPAVSQGMALADLDNDGDLDVIINNLNGPAALYRNDTTAPRVAVRLHGLGANTRGIGAKIKFLGGPVAQSQEMICGGRYLSSDDPMRVFATGAATNGLSIEVTWRSGRRSVLADVRANAIYEIDEAAASFETRVKLEPEIVKPFFRDASSLINHTHHEEPFDDFALQPTLPKRFSQLGPGVSWFDVDGDGWDDLIVPSGRGGALAVFHNDGRGGFQPMTGPPMSRPVTRDQTSVLGWRKAGGEVVLLAGSANYEDGLANGSVVRQYDLAGKTVVDTLPGQAASTGPLALADIDGDGDLDLFVGGRLLAGHYAESASSLLFRDHGGQFAPDAENTKRFTQLGLVSGAVFSDFDGDGDPDLILACEWGPVRIFRNEQGKFSEVTEQLGLGRYAGWWNGVATGDFDGDGRLDIIASNWGRNTRYESFRRQPLHLFTGDLDGDGVVEVIEGYHHPQWKPLAPLQPFFLIGGALPLVRERLGTFEAYAKANLDEIYAGQLKTAKELQANWLETTVFLNRGDHFEARPLPVEAQMAPAFAVGVGDFDGDGREDVFLSQNFFAVAPDTSRCDAGRGLWLRGDGQGGFSAVSGTESGVLVYGEQRGAALGDYDGDGRVDLVVTQNGAATKLFHNEGAKPGLRVRLKGPPGNPSGIGAAMRVVADGKMGPLREIHAGSGYWSQDSAVQVLSSAEPVSQLWIRWPGGQTRTTDIPRGAKEVAVDPSGRTTVLR